MAEIGQTGSVIVSGRIERPQSVSDVLGEDYLSEFTADTVDKMIRSDGTCSAIWYAITLPLLAAEWDLVPASDKRTDRRIADFVGENLWPDFQRTLEQALSYLLYGHFIFEVVYGHSDGQIVWEKLSPRLPWTIEQWNVRNGELVSIVQYAMDTNTGQYREFTIPADRILRFTNRQVGLNFAGVSIFRAAYKHWKIKDVLYKIDAIRHERYGVGVPIVSPPEGTSSADRASLEAAARTLQSNEASYIMLPAGSDPDKVVKVLTGQQGTGTNVLDSIRHHDMLILRSVLTEFLALGEAKFGSRSVSADQTGLFMLSLQGIADNIGEVFTHGHAGENGGISDLVRYNFGSGAGVPRLHCAKIPERSISDIMSGIAELTKAGVITPDVAVENQVRDLVGLPQVAVEGA